MPSQAAVPTNDVPITELYDGLAADGDTMFAEPYDDDEIYDDLSDRLANGTTACEGSDPMRRTALRRQRR